MSATETPKAPHCGVCGVFMHVAEGHKPPAICSICEGPRSLVRLFAEIAGKSPEAVAERQRQFVAARGASWTPRERRLE